MMFARERNVMLVGITSNPMGISDPALSIFTHRLKVELPGRNDRRKIMLKILEEMEIQVAEDVDIDFWAKITPTYSYPELLNLCELASSVRLEGLHENASYSPTELRKVTKADFMTACEKVEVASKQTLISDLKSWGDIHGGTISRLNKNHSEEAKKEQRGEMKKNHPEESKEQNEETKKSP